MKKIYISPVIVAEEILDDEILATSNPQMDTSNKAQKGGGDAQYEGDALSKDFSGFLDEDFGW